MTRNNSCYESFSDKISIAIAKVSWCHLQYSNIHCLILFYNNDNDNRCQDCMSCSFVDIGALNCIMSFNKLENLFDVKELTIHCLMLKECSNVCRKVDY